MKHILILIAFTVGAVASAHPGHPGAEGHGDPTHLILGLVLSLPLLGGLAWLFTRRAARRAEQTVESRKETARHG